MNINTTNINMKNDNTSKSLSSNQNTEVIFSNELEELEKNQSTEKIPENNNNIAIIVALTTDSENPVIHIYIIMTNIVIILPTLFPAIFSKMNFANIIKYPICNPETAITSAKLLSKKFSFISSSS